MLCDDDKSIAAGDEELTTEALDRINENTNLMLDEIWPLLKYNDCDDSTGMQQDYDLILKALDFLPPIFTGHHSSDKVRRVVGLQQDFFFLWMYNSGHPAFDELGLQPPATANLSYWDDEDIQSLFYWYLC